MNREELDRLAHAVLYEGYILYPYRPSVKNRQRWTFGSLYPADYVEVERGAERAFLQVECLVHGPALESVRLNVALRFLHLQARIVGRIVDPPPADGREPQSEHVEQMLVDGRLYQSWHEAVEQEREWRDLALSTSIRPVFTVPARRSWETLGAEGSIVREQRQITGDIEFSTETLATDLLRLRLRVRNTTSLGESKADREEATLSALAAAHVVLHIDGGDFISLQDPPPEFQQAATACQNVGAWPIIIGEPGTHDTMLAPPIILYDYPQIAPESPGDLFDGTEIDEILTLRILTLTDEEKQAVGAIDARARALLDRTERLAPEQLLGMHGRLRPAGESAHE
jgi:hydrogenase maturation protease